MIGFMGFFSVGDALLGKDSQTGKIALWSALALAPFHAFNYVMVRAKFFYLRATRGVEAANRVSENLYVGNLFSDAVAQKEGFEWAAIVDLTCEFNERSRGKFYMNLPVHDGNPPSLRQCLAAGAFVREHIADGPVLVHCAYGIGRSCTVACACLLALGRAADVDTAFATVKASRPVCRLNARMRSALNAYEGQLKDVASGAGGGDREDKK